VQQVDDVRLDGEVAVLAHGAAHRLGHEAVDDGLPIGVLAGDERHILGRLEDRPGDVLQRLVPERGGEAV